MGLGLTQAGFNVVLANDIEKDFANSFKKNHKLAHVVVDDIHNIDFKREMSTLGSPPIDLVSGGPPCQGFSTIGSKNIRDSRNNLFHEFLRSIREIKPKYLLFENVSGFSRLYGGEVYRALLSELDSLGYDTHSGILDASDFGLPQVRKRTIVLGWKKGMAHRLCPRPPMKKEGTYLASLENWA